jgi:hypothetical protein
MSLSILCRYHSEDWYFCHSDLLCYVSWYTVSVSLEECYFCHSGLPCYVFDSAVSVSPRIVLFLSQWFITLWVYCRYMHLEYWWRNKLIAKVYASKETAALFTKNITINIYRKCKFKIMN